MRAPARIDDGRPRNGAKRAFRGLPRFGGGESAPFESAPPLRSARATLVGGRPLTAEKQLPFSPPAKVPKHEEAPASLFPRSGGFAKLRASKAALPGGIARRSAPCKGALLPCGLVLRQLGAAEDEEVHEREQQADRHERQGVGLLRPVGHDERASDAEHGQDGNDD